MPEEKITLESLAERVAALERALLTRPTEPVKDWRSAIGMFRDSELSDAVDAAGAAIREQDREEARRES
jgi:hypothetical protein